MAMVKIPKSVVDILILTAADVVSSVCKKLVEEMTTPKCDTPITTETMEYPIGSGIRIRIRCRR